MSKIRRQADRSDGSGMSGSEMNSREIALRAIIEFLKTLRKPAVIMHHVMPENLHDRDKDMVREMVLGGIKLRKKMEFIAQSYVKAPLNQQEIEIKAALILGFYQLIEMSGVPDFAAVNETVSAVKNVVSEKSAGFINAILRAYLMYQDKTRFPDRENDPVKFLSLFYSYPEWIVRRWLDRRLSSGMAQVPDPARRCPDPLERHPRDPRL